MKFQIPPDFSPLWCQTLLHHPSTTIMEIPTTLKQVEEGVSNAMFAQTLYSPRCIRAQINLRRPTSEPDAIAIPSSASPSTDPWEYCYLMSLGPGIDGKTGRAHGGFNALVLDQIAGSLASQIGGKVAPATATMTVDYRAPISTPGVVLVRGWCVERSGRKTWVKGVIEDGEGQVLAQSKALFIDPREGKM